MKKYNLVRDIVKELTKVQNMSDESPDTVVINLESYAFLVETGVFGIDDIHNKIGHLKVIVDPSVIAPPFLFFKKIALGKDND